MLNEAYDYRAECEALNELLLMVPEAAFTKPTQFKAWTIDDVLGHLHMFDMAARLTLDGATKVQAFFAQIQTARAAGRTLTEYTRYWLDGCQGQALRERWFSYAMELAEHYRGQDARHRVAWGGPDMSVRSCITARQMEIWSHGQALFDLLGIKRQEADRIRNIATIGVNTCRWNFANCSLPVPEQPPAVVLTAPSGATWTWHEDESENRIEGSAVDFCRVVTQTRNIRDTGLQVKGDRAAQWMSIAQCFAGPPQSPPAPGTRYRQTV